MKPHLRKLWGVWWTETREPGSVRAHSRPYKILVGKANKWCRERGAEAT